MTTTESRRECNKCGKSKLPHKFKHEDKKTCLKCEFRWKQRILRRMAYTTKLSPYQKVASRVGYMGSGFLIAAQWTSRSKAIHIRVHSGYDTNIFQEAMESCST